jgi:hypothetical protein
LLRYSEGRPEGGDLVRGCLRRSVHGRSESQKGAL